MRQGWYKPRCMHDILKICAIGAWLSTCSAPGTVCRQSPARSHWVNSQHYADSQAGSGGGLPRNKEVGLSELCARNLQILHTIFMNSAYILRIFSSRFPQLKIIIGIAV